MRSGEAYGPGWRFAPNMNWVYDLAHNFRGDVKFASVGTYPDLYMYTDNRSGMVIAVPDTADTTSQRLIRLDWTFVGEEANGADPVSWDDLGMRYNFYQEDTPFGATDVQPCKRVVYEDIYDDIDYHVLSNAHGPKWLIVIRPGGHPEDIVLQFSGQDSLKVNVDEGLEILKGTDLVVLNQALAYQQDGEDIVPVDWQPNYAHDEGSVHVNFNLGEYDTDLPLILEIMPWQPAMPPPEDAWTALPEWCTNLAGSGGNDMVSGLDHDGEGNVYYTGHSNSLDGLPVTTGLVVEPIGNYDFIIGRFNEHYEMEVLGTWLTYMGGAQDDRGFSVAYDGENDRVAACGRATSNTTALVKYTGDQYHSGGYGAIAVFDGASGVREYCTQLPGWGPFLGDPKDLEYDVDGNLHVVGTGDLYLMDVVDPSGDIDYTMEPGFADPEWLAFDAYVARFDPGMHLTWFTAFGGPQEDGANSLAMDHANGKLYIGGYTYSNNLEWPGYCQNDWAGDFPLCPGGGWFQDALNAVNNDPDQGCDGFVACFDLTTLHLDWSTYFGSLGNRESITDLAVNSLGDLYAVGCTNIAYMSGANCTWDADGFPHCTPTGAYLDNSNLGAIGAHFIARFSLEHDLTWSSFLSGDWAEYNELSGGGYRIPRVTCDDEDNVFVHGSTSSGASNFGGGTDVIPMHWNSGYYNHFDHNDPQPGTDPAPAFDGYIAGFKPDCTVLYASFIGGIGQDFVGDIEAFSGRLYVGGATGANLHFPLQCPTLPGYQPYCAEPTPVVGDHDGYLAQLRYDYTVGMNAPVTSPYGPLRLYPNPAMQELTIDFAGRSADRLDVLDAMGRIISSHQTTSRVRVSIPVDRLAPGPYVIRAADETGVRTSRFIKH